MFLSEDSVPIATQNPYLRARIPICDSESLFATRNPLWKPNPYSRSRIADSGPDRCLKCLSRFSDPFRLLRTDPGSDLSERRLPGHGSVQVHCRWCRHRTPPTNQRTVRRLAQGRALPWRRAERRRRESARNGVGELARNTWRNRHAFVTTEGEVRESFNDSVGTCSSLWKCRGENAGQLLRRLAEGSGRFWRRLGSRSRACAASNGHASRVSFAVPTYVTSCAHTWAWTKADRRVPSSGAAGDSRHGNVLKKHTQA